MNEVAIWKFHPCFLIIFFPLSRVFVTQMISIHAPKSCISPERKMHSRCDIDAGTNCKGDKTKNILSQLCCKRLLCTGSFGLNLQSLCPIYFLSFSLCFALRSFWLQRLSVCVTTALFGKSGMKFFHFGIFLFSCLLIPALISREINSWACPVSWTVHYITGSFSSACTF